MDDLIIKVLVRLAGVYENHSERVYLDAGHRALLGIARAVQDETERRAGVGGSKVEGPVIKFPLDRAWREKKDRDDA